MQRFAPVLVCLPLLASCAASHVSFRPLENLGSPSPRGWPSASYPIARADGASSADLRVWSAGAERVTTGAVLRVGFEVENRGSEGVALDLERTAVRDVSLRDGPVIPELGAPLVDGDPAVAPAAAAVIELAYELPPGVDPDDVLEFAVAWTLADGHAQRTAFRRAPRSSRAHPSHAEWSGYRWYDPWWYGPYGRFSGEPYYYWKPGRKRE